MTPFVVTVEDTQAGIRRRYVFNRGPVLLGRSEGMHVRLARPYVSQVHGMFRVDDESIVYKDLGSQNGTQIDGVPASGSTDINDCSIMRIGALRITFSRDLDALPEQDGPDPFRSEAPNPPGVTPATLALTPAGLTPPEPRAATISTLRFVDRSQSTATPTTLAEIPVRPLVESPELLTDAPVKSDRAGPVPTARPPSLVVPSPIAPAPVALLDDGPTVWDPRAPATAKKVTESPPEVKDSDKTLPPGTRLGKYQIAELLGVGGMGSVYRAIHTGIGKDVAIKVLRSDRASDRDAQARFLREAASACMLRHPHVVDVADFGAENGHSYLVMEYLEGRDLGAVIAEEHLPIERIADIMLAVCAAVTAAHQAGILHRDLKPDNIFLARTALGEIVPKVVDFGISRPPSTDVSPQLTSEGMILGTPHYMAAEQLSGLPAGPASDQYALGVILYECVTGQRPFEAPRLRALVQAVKAGVFAKPSDLRPDLPAGLERIIITAMSANAADRFQSVFLLGRELVPFASVKRRALWEDYFGRERPPQEEVRGAVPLSALPPRRKDGVCASPAGGTKVLPSVFDERVPEPSRPSPASRPDGWGMTKGQVRLALAAGALVLLAGGLFLSRRDTAVPSGLAGSKSVTVVREGDSMSTRRVIPPQAPPLPAPVTSPQAQPFAAPVVPAVPRVADATETTQVKSRSRTKHRRQKISAESRRRPLRP